MTVVDMYRWYRNLKSCTTIPLLQDECHEINYEIMVRKFSDMLCANLQDASSKQLAIRQGRDMSVASNGVIILRTPI